MFSDSELIHKTAGFVAGELGDDSSGHDWQHIRRVWINAKNIGIEEGADMLVVELAALLHDIDDWKVTGGSPDAPPEKARNFLQENGAGSDLVEAVCQVIGAIDYRGAITKTKVSSLEEKVVHDADKLDAIGAIGIARCFAFNGKIGQNLFLPDVFPCLDIDEKTYTDLKREENTAINHFFEKLLRLKGRMYTATGQHTAQKRHDFTVLFLREFFQEQGLKEWEKCLNDFLSNYSS